MMTIRNRIAPGKNQQYPENREDRVSLDPFQEIVGQLKAIHRRETVMAVELSCGTIEFPASSVEATICERDLSGHEGRVVAILRTASQENPLRIRLVENE